MESGTDMLDVLTVDRTVVLPRLPHHRDRGSRPGEAASLLDC